MNKINIGGHAAMFGANTMWGIMAPVAKMVMAAGAVTPLLLTNFRLVGAALLFWTLSAFLPKEHVPVRDLLRLAGAAMLGVLFNQGCYVFGVGLTSPGDASIITTTMPLWVMILAALFLHEPITWKKAGGIFFGASGALILVLSSSSAVAAGNNPMLGDILVMAAQISFSLYLTLYRNFIRKYSIVTLMKWMLTFAVIPMVIVSVPAWINLFSTELTPSDIFGSLYVVVGGTFVAYILMMYGQKHLRPTVVGIYNYVQPIVATSVGIFMGLDRLTPVKCIAVLLVFIGVSLVTMSKAASHPTPTPVDE